MNTAASISLSQINSSMFFTNGNVGINTTVPASTVDISGTFRASGVSALTNVTATNVSTGVLIASTGLTTGTISASGTSTLQNVTANSITTGTLTATTSVSSGLLSATNVIGDFISAGTLSGTTITGANLSLSGNLTIAGTLTTVNITSTNVLNTNVSAGTIASTNIVGTNVSTGSIRSTGVVNLTSTTAIQTTTNNYSLTSGALNVSGDIVLSGTELMFVNSGVSPPTMNGRNSGSKIVLWPETGVTQGDYSIGIENSNMWHQVPSNNAGYKFYQGTSANLVIATGGNIGIGTDIPGTGFGATIPNAKLTLSSGISGAENVMTRLSIGSGSGHYSAIEGGHTINGRTTLAFMTCFNAGTNSGNPLTRMYITREGYVGINTTSPAHSLDVNGTGRIGVTMGNGSADFFIDNINSRIALQNYYYNSSGKGIARFAHNAYWDTNGSTQLQNATLPAWSIEMGNNPDSFVLYRYNTSGSFITPIVVANSGNVGISTGTPAYTLDVVGTIRGSSVAPVAHVFGTNSGTNHSIYIQSGIGSLELGLSNGNGNFVTNANSGDAIIKATTNKGIVLQGNNGNGVYAYVTNAGVGINTLSPGYTLDVAGTGNFSNLLVNASNPSMQIKGTHENQTATLFFGTPHPDGGRPNKAAIICEGITDHSRSKMHFCLDNTGSNNAEYIASVSNSKMTILPSGNVGIGNNNPSWSFQVKSGFYVAANGYGDQLLIFANGSNTSNGYFYYSSSNVYGTISDERIKNDITPINSEDAIAFISNITPSNFCLNGQTEKQSGFIAQNVLAAAQNDAQKSAVAKWETYDETDPECPLIGVSDRPILSNLIVMVKHQQTYIQALESRLAALEQR
jgi:hypothetical protein